ncbi:transducin family protein / WD-40 repeat family protein [Tasmannia lanceolata]|uniref:transducin family protein / WD-40 repeat family protein n=1 Tax=Tasmannia lanceolata TaxID=3420 RepID=UPI004062EAA1
MASSNIKDLLTSFSPSLDFFAITSGDGRIKIWDTLKGQVQTEFADIPSSDGTYLHAKSENGHLSLDYTCMKWISLDYKKKRKHGYSLLVLGTGSGDVLALDVSAGQLKWRYSDCHPGGVNAIAFSGRGSSIYTAGVDGMVCQIDSMTGSPLGKFRASTKAISSMSISPDGMTLATAAGQLKLFNCSDNKRMRKFSGHPVAVRCMVFTEDGKYILSSAIGEKYIAVWKLDGSKKQSSSCVLSMDHPAVFLDSKVTDNGPTDDLGFYVLAISELGLCYFWYGRNIEELRNTKPTKISLSFEAPVPKNHKVSIPTIFAAKLQGIVRPASGVVFAAYGSVIKPSFDKLTVQHGIDINLKSSRDGVLLPMDNSLDSQKRRVLQTEVTALDRANAEDAILPIPKLYDVHDKKRKHNKRHSDVLVNSESEFRLMSNKDDPEKVHVDTGAICMEDRLRSLGILDNEDHLNSESYSRFFTGIAPNSTILSDAHLLGEANVPTKKIKAAILSMSPNDAFEFLKVLVAMWKSRSSSGKYVLPWIHGILINHSHYVISQEASTQMLEILYEMTRFKCAAIQPLLQLSGRLQLIMAQIDKAGHNMHQAISNEKVDESEEEDEDIDEFVYGEEEDESQGASSDDDMEHQP